MFRKSTKQVAVCWKESDAMRWHVRAPKPELESCSAPSRTCCGSRKPSSDSTDAASFKRKLKGASRHSKELAVFLWPAPMSIK
jgi:hypothetical protein